MRDHKKLKLHGVMPLKQNDLMFAQNLWSIVIKLKSKEEEITWFTCCLVSQYLHQSYATTSSRPDFF